MRRESNGGLRVIEWVVLYMKLCESHMVSGKMPLVLVPENGRFFQWLFHANQNVSSTHTDFHFFALWKRYAAYLVIPRRGSLLLFGAQKNSLQRLRSNAFRLVRQEAAAGARPPPWRPTQLSGGRAPTGALPALRQSETRAARLSGRQPALHQAVCMVCGQAGSQQHGIGHRPRIASGLAHS